MDKRKAFGALLLFLPVGYLLYKKFGASSALNPITAAAFTPTTIAPLPVAALPPSQAAAFATIVTKGIAVSPASLPAGVPAGSRLLGYYTPVGAKHYNGIIYQNGTLFYVYNINQKKVSVVGAKGAAPYINSPQFRAAH